MQTISQAHAKRFIEDHSHVVHVDGDRLIAEVECVHRDGRVTIEYGTFAAPHSLREIRAWLGY